MGAYDGMTERELMDLAKQIMMAWVKEPVGSVERAMKAAAHESVMLELKKRIARRVNLELGLPDIDI